MAKVILYHGTSVHNADKIMSGGFKQCKSNWTGDIVSKKGFIYLTSAYSIYFAIASAKKLDQMASIIAVEVDEDLLYPDEDYINWKFKINHKKINLEEMSEYGTESLHKLGNVAVRLGSKLKILGRKDFSIREMLYYSDPSISPMAFSVMGEYYKELSRRVYNGESLENFNSIDYVVKSFNNYPFKKQ